MGTMLSCHTHLMKVLPASQPAGYHQLFKEAVQRLEGQGGRKITLDMSSFLAAAKLLYESALLAERVSGLRAFLEQGRVRQPSGSSCTGLCT